MFLSCVDKHAPLKSKRVRRKRCPRIGRDLLCKIRRGFLKKKAISFSDSTAWDQYKSARNQAAKNAITLAKKPYISDNMEIN